MQENNNGYLIAAIAALPETTGYNIRSAGQQHIITCYVDLSIGGLSIQLALFFGRHRQSSRPFVGL